MMDQNDDDGGTVCTVHTVLTVVLLMDRWRGTVQYNSTVLALPLFPRQDRVFGFETTTVED